MHLAMKQQDVTISIILLLLYTLRTQLKISSLCFFILFVVFLYLIFDYSFATATDSTIVAEFRKALLTGVNTRYLTFYLTPDKKEILMAATMLDPRFKSLVDIPRKFSSTSFLFNY